MTPGPLVIPQTFEQAIQRDRIAGHDPTPPLDPIVELVRLRQAIVEHEREVREIESVPAEEFHAKARDLLAKRRQADLRLWELAR